MCLLLLCNAPHDIKLSVAISENDFSILLQVYCAWTVEIRLSTDFDLGSRFRFIVRMNYDYSCVVQTLN